MSLVVCVLKQRKVFLSLFVIQAGRFKCLVQCGKLVLCTVIFSLLLIISLLCILKICLCNVVSFLSLVKPVVLKSFLRILEIGIRPFQCSFSLTVLFLYGLDMLFKIIFLTDCIVILFLSGCHVILLTVYGILSLVYVILCIFRILVCLVGIGLCVVGFCLSLLFILLCIVKL